jgi:hypothetical protein
VRQKSAFCSSTFTAGLYRYVEEVADKNLDMAETDFRVAQDPFPKCFVSCFRPGACNRCCKGLGYHKGMCVNYLHLLSDIEY